MKVTSPSSAVVIPARPLPTEEVVTIVRLGRRGDGIAETARGPVHIPYALPGESARILREGERGRLIALERAAPERIAPICALFGRCGGCAAQHMTPALYRDWKAGALGQALAREGVSAPIAVMIDAHGAGRRRVTFHARREGGAVVTGFMAARSHDLIQVDACPVLAPGLARAPKVAAALAKLLCGSGKPLDIQVTASDAGLDVDLRGHGPVSDKLRLVLAEAARRLDLARLALHGEAVVEIRPPAQSFGRAHVVPGPGGFLQATAAGEAELARLVIEAMPPKARLIADLFAGCGPFALRLAEAAEVNAFESDKAAVAALTRAANATPGLRKLVAEQRDLFRRPLLEHELNGFDAVVLDPPRAGAEAQARRLAASIVPVVAYVSCDVASFARDAAILVAGGHVLEAVTPVDQFRYSAHIELVGVFRRPKVPGKRTR